MTTHIPHLDKVNYISQSDKIIKKVINPYILPPAIANIKAGCVLTRTHPRARTHTHTHTHTNTHTHSHHHHHVVPLARISLTLSRHFSLSFIASDRSSGLHPVSSRSYYMYVRAGRPAFAWPYVGVLRSTSLMSSSLFLKQCPACLVRLTWIVSWWM